MPTVLRRPILAFALGAALAAAAVAGTAAYAALNASGNGTTVQAGKDLTVPVGRDLAVATSVHGTGDVTIDSDRRAILRGATGVVVESGGPMSVEGASARIETSGATVIKGSAVQINP